MKDYNFYIIENDKIKIYSEDLQKYFEDNFNIKVDSIDFDSQYNVILYCEQLPEIKNSIKFEKTLLKQIKCLNDVEVKNTKIILFFNCKLIELC